MRCLASPEFLEKFKALATRPDIRASVDALVNRIQTLDRETLVSPSSGLGLVASEKGVYVFRSGDLRVFLTIGSDHQGHYVLLLDLAEKRTEAAPLKRVPFRNPVTDARLNPRHNAAINPRYNTSLNPRYNTALNPTYNTALNPNFNTAINPRFNTALNPRFNTSLNPRFNTSLNPRYNTTLNPQYNATYSGPYVFDLDLGWTGYLVQADGHVLLHFSPDGELAGTMIKTPADGYNIFDNEGKWVGYLVPDRQGGFLRFQLDGTWNGIVA